VCTPIPFSVANLIFQDLTLKLLFDLTYALARALETPDVVQRWRNGERLFEASR